MLAFTVIATLLFYLLYAFVRVSLVKREGWMYACFIIFLACALSTGVILGSPYGTLGQVVGGFLGFLIAGYTNRLLDSYFVSPARQERVIQLFSSQLVGDRLWAISNIWLDREGFALVRQAALNDSSSQVREGAVRWLAVSRWSVETLETLKSAREDSSEAVRNAARDSYQKMGGELLSKEWQVIYSRLRKLKEEGRRTRLTLSSLILSTGKAGCLFADCAANLLFMRSVSWN